jgi:hypothetical protein
MKAPPARCSFLSKRERSGVSMLAHATAFSSESARKRLACGLAQFFFTWPVQDFGFVGQRRETSTRALVACWFDGRNCPRTHDSD